MKQKRIDWADVIIVLEQHYGMKNVTLLLGLDDEPSCIVGNVK